jgi:hypothetical protein
MSKMREGLL